MSLLQPFTVSSCTASHLFCRQFADASRPNGLATQSLNPLSAFFQTLPYFQRGAREQPFTHCGFPAFGLGIVVLPCAFSIQGQKVLIGLHLGFFSFGLKVLPLLRVFPFSIRQLCSEVILSPCPPSREINPARSSKGTKNSSSYCFSSPVFFLSLPLQRRVLV